MKDNNMNMRGNNETTNPTGSNPCRTANNTNVFDGIGESRTDSAQKTPESEMPKMKFPKVIRHLRVDRSLLQPHTAPQRVWLSIPGGL